MSFSTKKEIDGSDRYEKKKKKEIFVNINFLFFFCLCCVSFGMYSLEKMRDGTFTFLLPLHFDLFLQIAVELYLRTIFHRAELNHTDKYYLFFF